ncbi:DNA alkylation repair protein [Alginatibacterium sediminis]|uniref:DNA alkylation repair protein n=1 Tax=Alginatibacterium sediminis TaxID=2164068 RepID=A0A420E8I7_9ALTE|nr:DNA alkylation repair protein [Alginatibacterium sediminis]RKF15687.1 DNA alkylation repair protein [Alginatibacterium sediminis]
MNQRPVKSAQQLIDSLESLANPEQALLSLRYMKSAPGDYAFGDQFLGVKMGPIRDLAKTYRNLPLSEVLLCLHSPWHEVRSCALVIWTLQFAKATAEQQQTIYRDYLANTDFINNWDLVDISTPKIVGLYLLDKPRNDLYQLVKSDVLWQRRIAVLACFPMIRNGESTDILKLCEVLLEDKEDLIHKACGWMLRELAKRNQAIVEQFLQDHYSQINRTQLRYAIERFEPELRQRYLKGQF